MPYGDPAGYLPRVKRARLRNQRTGSKSYTSPSRKKGPTSLSANLAGNSEATSNSDHYRPRQIRKTY